MYIQTDPACHVSGSLGEQTVHQNMLVTTRDGGGVTSPLHIVPPWVPHTTRSLGS